MPDPMLMAVAAAAAGKTTELLVQGGKSALEKLVNAVRARIATDDEASKALAQVERPDSGEVEVSALASRIETLRQEDPAFASQLDRHLSVVTKTTNFSIGPDARVGKVMQLENLKVDGDFHF